MPSFYFRLAALHRLRLADRDQHRADLAEARAAEDTLLTEARAVAQERSQIQQLSRILGSPGQVDVDRLMAAHRYEVALRAKLQVLAEKLHAARAEAEYRRLALVEADRQVHILQKLREKQHGAHQAREEKQEQKCLDDSALAEFLRREAATQ
jgi:flagellar export protein FliJ